MPLSLASLALGDFTNVFKYGEEALAMYHKGTWEHTVVYVLNVLGLAHLGLGRIEEGADCLQQARAQAHADDNPRVEGLALFNLARMHQMKNDWAAALSAVETAQRMLLTALQSGRIRRLGENRPVEVDVKLVVGVEVEVVGVFLDRAHADRHGPENLWASLWPGSQ